MHQQNPIKSAEWHPIEFVIVITVIVIHWWMMNSVHPRISQSVEKSNEQRKKNIEKFEAKRNHNNNE